MKILFRFINLYKFLFYYFYYNKKFNRQFSLYNLIR